MDNRCCFAHFGDAKADMFRHIIPNRHLVTLCSKRHCVVCLHIKNGGYMPAYHDRLLGDPNEDREC